jgi:hypothetical protein
MEGNMSVIRQLIAPMVLACTFALPACSVQDVSVVEGERDRIVITDVKGERWDITTAAYDYKMDPEKFEHGLGKDAIVPLDSPPMLSPGDRGYPSDDASFLVVGTVVGDDIRAYGKLDIVRHEVVDAVIGGAHLAVTY